MFSDPLFRDPSSLVSTSSVPVSASFSPSLCIADPSFEVSQLTLLLSKFFVDLDITIDSSVVLSRIAAASVFYNPVNAESAALAAANGFRLPSDIVLRDSFDFSRTSSLVDLVQDRQQLFRHDRFNSDRCRLFMEDPEYATLMDIAVNGAYVPVPSIFRETTSPPRFRPVHARLQSVFERHAFDLSESGTVLLLNSSLLDSVPLHYSSLHWTVKPGKALGRLLGDLSNSEISDSALNTDETRLELEGRYGSLYHPTIVDFIDYIFMAIDKWGLANITFFKEDIANAFAQFPFDPSCTRHLAFQLSTNVTMIYLYGMFGWTGAPFVFGVFSRALLRLIQPIICSFLVIYVDDFMAVGPSYNILRDKQTVIESVRSVFGPSAINEAKSIPPSRQMEFIGWFLDLDSFTVRPNDKGILKLAVAFFHSSPFGRKSIPLVQWEKLASLATRYSTMLVAMRPFVQPFMIRTSRKSGFARPNSAAKVSMIVWRMVSIFLLSDKNLFSVPLCSVRSLKPVPRVTLITDASPLGAGLAVYDYSLNTCIFHFSYRFPFNTIESEFQNSREFLALLISCIVLCFKGYKDTPIHWIGDNMSSLSWIEKNMVSSSSSQASFLAFTWILLGSRNQIVSSAHRAGVDMGDIDGLSRFMDTSFSAETAVDPSVTLILDPIISLCDPSLLTSSRSILDRLTSIISLCRNIVFRPVLLRDSTHTSIGPVFN